MSSIQYNQYLNLHEFATKWRGYEYDKSKKLLDEDAFRALMQSDQYVKLEYVNKFEKPVQIYLLSPTSKYNNNQTLKQLLVKIKNPTDVILVTDQPLKKYAYDNINIFKHLRVNAYLHRHFDIVMPNAPLVYKHRIMSRNEVLHLLNEDLRCTLINLPKILIEDVQCIWIGAEVGDVIEITIKSDIVGESVRYHVVVPKSGRVISFRQQSVDEPPEEDDIKEEIENDIPDDKLEEDSAEEDI